MNLLEQLRDVHLPAEPSFWPPAPGWWLLSILAIGGVAYVFAIWQRRRSHLQYRRQALEGLARLDPSTASFTTDLIHLLRRTALSAPGQHRLAALPTAALLSAVDQSAQGELSQALQQHGLSIEQFAQALYSGRPAELNPPQAKVFSEAAVKWVRNLAEAPSC